MKKLIVCLILLASLTQAQSVMLLFGSDGVASIDTIPSQFTFADVTDAAVSSYNQGYIVVAGCDSARFYTNGTDSLKLGALGTYDVSEIWADVGDTVYMGNVASASNSTTTNKVLYSSNGTPLDTFTVTTVAGGGEGSLTPKLQLIWDDSVTYSGSRTVTSWIDNGWAFTDDTTSGNKVVRTDSSIYFNNAVLTLADATGNPFDFGDSSFTVAIWMWMDTTTSGGAGNQKIIMEKDAGGAPSWYITNTNASEFNELSVRASNGVDTTSGHRSGVSVAGSWKHIVSVYEKGVNHRIYIDSVFTNGSYSDDAWANLEDVNFNNGEPAKIGSTSGSGQHIAGIKIYWEALTPAQIKALYEEGRP